MVRGVGGVCNMCMCLARSGVGGEWVKDWVWALPILQEQGESGICVRVLVAVMFGGVCGQLGPWSGRVWWC